MASEIMGQPAVYAFLQSVLRILYSLINSGGHGLFLDFNSQLMSLEKMMFGLQDVLVDAERRRLVEKSVDRWMDDLKDFLYDTEDLLDEINTEKQRLKQGCDGQSSSSNQVRNDVLSDYYASTDMRSEIGKVLGRIEELSRGAVRLDLKRDVGLQSANLLANQSLTRPRMGPFADESEIYGRQEDKDKIIEMLLAEDGGMGKKNYDVVCLVGMGGLGKTTLAQIVFEDERICSFFEVKSWACVSDVFDVVRVTKEIIESAEEGADVSRMQLAGLQKRLKGVLYQKKFFLVLDDVWTSKEWDNLKLPFNFGAKGSKILVTTRHRKVAEALNTRAPYQLGRLEDNQIFEIFNNKAFGLLDETDIDADLIDMSEKIAKKCGGVPLVAKVIGAMLRGEDHAKWKVVTDNDIWNLAYEDEDLHPGLRLSYFYLPSFLKRCFEYLALFPSDFEFDKDEIVRLWMAEGLIETKEGTGTDLEEIGIEYYNDLKGRCLIQEDDRMHDMVHHLACICSGSFVFKQYNCASSTSIANVRHAYVRQISELSFDVNKLHTLYHDSPTFMEVCPYKRIRVLTLTLFSRPPSPSLCDMKHLRYLRLKGILWNLDHLERICMLINLQALDLSCQIQNLPEDLGKLSNLRFLGLRGTKITSLPQSVCSLSNLRVLDLSECFLLMNLPEDIDPGNSIGMLSNLRVLNLPYCMKISSLPESVCNLLNLQVLNLSGCSRLTTLPNDIGNLKRLHVLKVDEKLRLPKSIVNAINLRALHFGPDTQPPHVGNLTKLEDLGAYYVGKEKGKGTDELRDMNRLKGILTIRNMENTRSVEEALAADLKSKKHLDRIDLCWVKDYTVSSTQRNAELEMGVLEVLEPHAAIKDLSFDGYIGHKFPGWMSSTGFYNLTELWVCNLPNVTEMKGMVFQSLKVLHLMNCPSLKEVSMTTPKLEELTVLKCKELKPSALVLLPQPWETLHTLNCDYYHLDDLLQQIKGTNGSPCTKLRMLAVIIRGDVSISSSPVGYSSIITSLETLSLEDLPLKKQKTSIGRDISFSSLTVRCSSINLNLPPKNFRILSVGHSESFQSLKKLTICDDPDLVSLKFLELPHNLNSLNITNCSNLMNLPSGLCDLSLQEINLVDCPNLVISSHDILPPSIREISIRSCRKLEEQVRRENRADWKNRYS